MLDPELELELDVVPLLLEELVVPEELDELEEPDELDELVEPDELVELVEEIGAPEDEELPPPQALRTNRQIEIGNSVRV